VQAELLVKHPCQYALEILAGRGLQHPDAALEVSRKIGANVHLALSAWRNWPSLLESFLDVARHVKSTLQLFTFTIGGDSRNSGKPHFAGAFTFP
jgi:hypothetical protein